MKCPRCQAEQAIDLRFDLRTALFPLGEFERSFGCLREAEGLARTLDDQRRLCQLSVYMCHNLRETGHLTEALAFGQNAQALAESLWDVPLQVTGNLNLGVACLYTGDYRRAEDLLRKVLQWLALPARRQRSAGAGAPHHRGDDVSRDGHAVLAGEGGNGDGGTRMTREDMFRCHRPL
jgi:tetratricopeptide (TPR) repeat protein